MGYLESPSVTVIIGTYNRAKILPIAIESVLGQTHPSFELLVIDNGATDETRKVVESYRDSRIQYLLNPHPTRSCAEPRNIGIRMSRAPLVAFLDDDDVWYREKLAISLRELERHPEAALICHAQKIVENGRVIRKNICGPWTDPMHERLIYEGNCLGPGSVVAKKESLLSVGGFDVREAFQGCEDYDLWIRLAAAGYRFHFIEEALAEFRWTGFNGSNDPCHSVRCAEMIRSHIESSEKTLFSRRARKRMASLYRYAAQQFLRHRRWKEACQYQFYAMRVSWM